MNRRQLLAGLALAQAPSPPVGESLFIPKPQLVEDRRFLHDFMGEFAFVDLVTLTPSLRITHTPVWLDRTAGPYGTIHGHISPTWYAATGNVVPTWNLAVVHAGGKLRPVEGRKELNDLPARLIARFESYEGTSYDFSRSTSSLKVSSSQARMEVPPTRPVCSGNRDRVKRRERFLNSQPLSSSGRARVDRQK